MLGHLNFILHISFTFALLTFTMPNCLTKRRLKKDH